MDDILALGSNGAEWYGALLLADDTVLSGIIDETDGIEEDAVEEGAVEEDGVEEDGVEEDDIEEDDVKIDDIEEGTIEEDPVLGSERVDTLETAEPVTVT